MALYWLLESYAARGLDFPPNTGHVTVEPDLVAYLSEFVLAVDGVPLNRGVVEAAFLGKPVKQAFGVVTGTVMKIPEVEERDLMLRRYAKKHSGRA